ncbi:MAG: hypothetical protein GZ091_12170 [Paludibacter sp.]|nr:hypothetical protein [Paludibacter sp.]
MIQNLLKENNSLVIRNTILIYFRFISIQFIKAIIFLLILSGVYYYSMQKKTFGLIIHIDYLINTKSEVPTWLYSIEYFTLIFLIVTIVLLVLIIYYKKNKTDRRKVRAKYIHIFVEDIFNYIYSNDVSEIEDKISKYWNNLKNDYAKRLFINIIRQIYQETTGQFHEKTYNLLLLLNIDPFIRSYLYSPFLRNNLFALKTIRDFQLIGYEKYILKLTMSKNKILNSAALITIVRFENYNNLLFLLNNNINLSFWNINNIIRTQQVLRNENIEYESLINSDNEKIVIMSIILIGEFRKTEYKKLIKNKIESSNILICEAAIKSYILLAETKDDFFYLMYIYKSASEQCKIEILNSLFHSPDKSNIISFLIYVALNESVTQKIIAVKILLKIDLLQIAKLKRSNNPEVSKVCDHVLDFNN